MKKIIAIDLDGTFLDSKKNIDLECKELIKKLNSKGYEIVLSSGRHYREMECYIQELELPCDSHVISNDGMYVYQVNGVCLWKGQALEYQDIVNIIRWMHSKKLLLVCNNTNYILVNSFIRFYLYKIRSFLLKRKEVVIRKVPQNIEVEKMMFYNCLSLKEASSSLERYTVHKMQEGKIGIEILPRDISKYTALVRLSEMLGISKSNIVFIGDDYNDLECFENITVNFAMENAVEEVKRKAKYVTQSNDEHGVRLALERIYSENY